MKTKIEFVRISNGFCWFLDVFVIDKFSPKGCWKNFGSYKSKDEALNRANAIESECAKTA